jgi:hypothetical protein
MCTFMRKHTNIESEEFTWLGLVKTTGHGRDVTFGGLFLSGHVQ